MSIFKRWIAMLIGCVLTIVILDWLLGLPFLYSYGILIGMCVGCSITSAITWFYENGRI